MWQVFIRESAMGDLKAITLPDRKRILKTIRSKIEQADDPTHFSKALSHQYQGLRSLRVGDYRVIYLMREAQKTIGVVMVAHRKHVYRDLAKRLDS